MPWRMGAALGKRGERGVIRRGPEMSSAGATKDRVRRTLAGVALTCATLGAIAPAASAQREPMPEPNAAVDVAPRPCALDVDDPYEQKMYELEGWKAPDFERYPG